MAEYLIMKLDKTNTDPVLDSGCAKKGDIIEIYQDGKCTEPPSPASMFVIIRVPGQVIESMHMMEWYRLIDFTILSSDITTDTHQVQVSALMGEYAPISGLGKVTRDLVENYLNDWKATVVSFSDNSVIFDVGIYDAVTSDGLWGQNVSQVLFYEQNYNKNTSVHRVSANYSAVPLSSQEIEHIVTSKGATIVSHDTIAKIIVFSITMAIVYNNFKEDVKQKLKSMLRKRKYYIDSATVDDIITNGNWKILTETQFTSALRNKVNI